MLRITACAFTAAFAGGCVLEVDETINTQPAPIVNGQINNGDPALGMVGVGAGGTCSGTLIANRVVVTARHCVLLERGPIAVDQLKLYWGTTPADTTPTDVVSFEYHDAADIAVLELAAAPTLNGAAIEPIPMYADVPTEGVPVRVAGFGVTAEEANDARVKRAGMTAMIRLEDAGEYGQVMFVGQAGSKTCYGDSGGPAFITKNGVEYIAGVTSFGTGECEAVNTLDGEVRVDVYRSWIVDFVNRKNPGGLPPVNSGNDGNNTGNGDADANNNTGDNNDTSADDPTEGATPNSAGPIGGTGLGCSAGSSPSGLVVLGLLIFVATVRRRSAVDCA